jgi:hypothetical protein
MERPAIRRLLADVQAKKVDCVLAYMVDRLSRSIRDFAKIMGILEKHGTTFVSVTQQFNATTSLGRLTLNILLSFAQFEREIISERTRDKQVLATALRTNRLCSGGTRKAVSLNQSTASASALPRRSTVGSRPDFCGTLMHLRWARRSEPLTFAFSRDGAQVYGIIRNTTGEGAQWQLHSIDVKTGADKMLAPVDLPVSADSIAGFSLHPDGKRFLTSIAKWPFDIWMLEGWDQPPQKTWLDRLLRR